MKKTFFVVVCAATVLAASAKGQAPATESKQEVFAALLSKGQKTPDAMTAEELSKLMQLSQEQGRAATISSVVRAYFAKRADVSQGLLKQAAENASAAGDYRLAVARYKQLLKVALPGPATTQAANDFYRILVDYLVQPDVAFQFMVENGDRIRSPGLGNVYDAWYLDRCYEQRMLGAMARRLVSILTEAAPIEQERLVYSHVDRYLERLSVAGPDKADAIVPGRKLPELIRGSPVRAARAKFLVENLAYRASAAGKEQAAVEKDFEAVLAAAQAYLTVAPKAATVRDIYTVFFGGAEAPSEAVWAMQVAQKQAFFEKVAFEKLSGHERYALLGWNWWDAQKRIATPSQWATLGARNVETFKASPARSTLSFVTLSKDPAVYKAQAQFLQGACTPDAAVINSLAATETFEDALKYLIEKESWYGSVNRHVELIGNKFVPAYNVWPRPATNEFRYMHTLAAFAENEVFKSPMAAFSVSAPSWALVWVWQNGGVTPADKSKFVTQLHMLDWIPYSAEDRSKVFELVRAEVKTWSDETRRLHEEAQKSKKPEAVSALAARVALVGPIAEALKQVSEAAGDPAKAPNAVCRDLALCMAALRDKNRDAFVAAGRTLYQTVRDYEAKKTPYGEAILSFLTANRLTQFDTIDFQCEILADQVGLCTSQGLRRGMSTVIANIHTGRPGWTYQWYAYTIPDQDRAIRAKLNKIFVKAVDDCITAGKPDVELFWMYRGVRQTDAADMELISKLIDQRSIQKNPGFRLWNPSATCSYMALIRNEFPAISATYPLERWFDDMMVEEIRKEGWVDPSYWLYGRDEQRKVANVLAELFGQATPLPFGYDDQPTRYTPAQYWELLGRAQGAEPAKRDAMLAKIESAYGTTRFDDTAAGRASLTYMPVATPEQRAAFVAKLNQYAERSAKAPSPFMLPYLPQILILEQYKNLGDAEVDALYQCFSKCVWMTWSGTDAVIDRYISVLNESLLARGKAKDLIPLVPMFWRIAREAGVPQLHDKLLSYSGQAMSKGEADLAAAYSSVGLEVMGSKLREDSRTALKALKSKALISMGGSITVDRSDRRYPIFAAQAFYGAGKLDNAWEQYVPAKAVALTDFKELDIEFSTWLVERHVEMGEYEAADALAQRLIEWVDSTPQGFDLDARARLLLAHASIAFGRQEYPRARAQYERIAVAREFENKQGARLAELRIADIDRITKKFDVAIERLEKLRRRPDPVLQAESNYQLAVIKFEQEDYSAARDFINLVFAADMNHANARILEGKVNLKMKKLVEATDLRVGMATDRNTIIPGKSLKIQIEDRNLSTVGRLANIEVRVWSASGDEEFFSLLPFGDSKTKFEGEVSTALAPQVKGDHVLQVLGRDKVSYSFSDKFKKAAGITIDNVTTIDVISDAELSISSGKILSKEEQEERALQQMMVTSGKVEANAAGALLSSMRADDEIKPGNPISVRVVDPDRSISAGKDKITMRAVTTSGDTVDGIVLEETDTHSGVFEGKIKTATAPATAFATDSEEGKEPAYAISASNYPPWVALGDNRRPKVFTVDLNNNVELERLNVVADVPGRLLKRFMVQTSMNGKDYVTVATYPAAMPDWDGYLRCRVVKYGNRTAAPATLSAYRQYLDLDYLVDGNELIVLPGMLSGKIESDVLGQAGRMGLSGAGAGSWYIAHLQGVFYMPERRQRTFRVDPKGRLSSISYILTVDGAVGKKPHEVSAMLEKGLHRFDLYIAAQRQSIPEFEMQCDIPEPPYMARWPTAAFMPSSRPKSAPPFVSNVAKIVADRTNNTFGITFAAGTSARIIRIGIADYEGDAPAIRRLTLTSAGGVKVLPTKEDILTLRRNDALEIVPGDRLSVIYEDPSAVTKEKKVLEAFMKATFYNATINACFIESGVDGRGMRQAQYIPMRRFRAGDPICVVITEPDGDVSDAQDKLKFTVRLAQGKSVEMEALESTAHSGVFMGRFFPVNGAPQRDSEIQVEPGDDIVLAYKDEQNTDYGVPWQRTCQVEQAIPSVPELRVYNYSSRLLGADELKSIVDKADVRTGETIPVTRELVASLPEAAKAGTVATNYIGCPLIAEVRYPTIALSHLSTAKLYVQTSSALKRAGRDAKGEFDPAVPGTLKYEFGPGDAAAITEPPGYRDVLVRGNSYGLDALDDGRFTFMIPVRVGEAGETVDAYSLLTSFSGNKFEVGGPSVSVSYVDEAGRTMSMVRELPWPMLYVQPDEEITVAFEVAGETNQPSKWLVQKAVLSADAFMDVMDQRYQDVLKSAFVGERAYLRIVDPMSDTNSGKDRVTVEIPLSGGSVTQALSLVETFPHSGIFKGSFLATYAGNVTNNVLADVVPVNYGDTVKMLYRPAAGGAVLSQALQMQKGADGRVLPFTKRFKEPEVAVQTQFTIAEAYFELAKKQRELKQEELARREIAQGKKLLEEAIRDYPETEERAHADYLLANLAMEYAEEIQDPELKKQRYMEAITRFGDLVSSYPTSPYAPKSQFKKALAFDKLGQLDQACEEYVKLSYRYPENELVAETIARLGQYFMTKGKEMQAQANAETDVVKKEKARLQMLEMYKASARVFERLAVRFPDHTLAWKTTVLAAQCWIRAEDLDKAIAVFGYVIDTKKADPDLLAQSMYWRGDCYMKKLDYENAYRMLKRLTWDYPETTWAKYARGRLSEKELASVEEKEAQK